MIFSLSRRAERALVTWVLAAVVTCIGYFTYFRGYSEPAAFFWDENYHVAHAQKYLNGVFFMEPHPPLGKLLIALGEKLLQANSRNDQFIGVDHAKDPPQGFSFEGYRFFPALLSWLAAPVLFFVFVSLTGRPVWAFLLSFLYLFDNALIVHSRGAMLESVQIFFIAVFFLSVVHLVPKPHPTRRSVAIFAGVAGLSLAATLATKVNALILILILPLIAWSYRRSVREFGIVLLIGGGSFLLLYAAIWQLHFSLGKSLQPTLPNQGWYEASPEFQAAVRDGNTENPLNFPMMLRDSYRFVAHYQRGVPKLNLCNQNENGSPALFWPFGGRTINYRWERSGGSTRYLYLVPNPANWLVCLGAVIAGIGLLAARLFLPLRYPLRHPFLLAVLAAMYGGYLLTMAALPRVMYLYHYFLPLLFGFLLCGVIAREIRALPSWAITLALSVIAMLSLGSYQHFAPLTYAHPLSDAEVHERAWIRLWDLRPVSAQPENGVAAPVCDPKVKEFPNVSISGVRAAKGYQGWGEPVQDRSVERESLVVNGTTFSSGIGVHAVSSLDFVTAARFARFTGKVGVPDYVFAKSGARPSVRFEIRGDGRLLWESPLITASGPALGFDIPISGVRTLQLSVSDGEDGIDNDHAVWLEPQFFP